MVRGRPLAGGCRSSAQGRLIRCFLLSYQDTARIPPKSILSVHPSMWYICVASAARKFPARKISGTSPFERPSRLGLNPSRQKSSDGKAYNPQTDGSYQEPLEVMEVLFANHDMLRAGEDHPARLQPAHDEPIED